MLHAKPAQSLQVPRCSLKQGDKQPAVRASWRVCGGPPWVTVAAAVAPAGPHGGVDDLGNKPNRVPGELHQGLAYEVRAQHNMVPPGVDASDTHRTAGKPIRAASLPWFGLARGPKSSSVIAKLSMQHPNRGKRRVAD